jgi:hypothetical protein
MRSSQFLVVGVMGAAALAFAGACGSNGNPGEFPGEGQTTAGGTTSGNTAGNGFGDAGPELGGNTAGTTAGAAVTITELRISPADAILDLTTAPNGSQTYVVEARINGSSTWSDITSRAVFYVPEEGNIPTAFTIGGFANNGPTFVPTAGTYGGKLKVRAAASNSDGTVSTVDANLTVVGSATKVGDSVPVAVKNEGADIIKRFQTGTGVTLDTTVAKKPIIAYPLDGTMMPPNLKRLTIHFTKGQINPVDGTNDLFQIEFKSPLATVRYYTACTVPDFVVDGCGFELDPVLYKVVAESNRGQETTITVRGAKTSDKTQFRESASIKVRFSDEDVNGALYYWDTTKKGIWRFDFGSTQAAPELFVKQGSGNTKGETDGCPGCHTLSRDGK